MNKIRLIVVGLLLLVLVGAVALATSQSNVGRSVVSSSGGEKSSASYKLRDVTGEAAVGTSQSNGYKLRSGFLPFFTTVPKPIQMPTPTPTPTPTTASGGGGGGGGGGASITPTPTPTPTPKHTPSPTLIPAGVSEKTNIGVIVGPIVAVIVLVLAAYWFLRIRKPPTPKEGPKKT